MKKFFKRFLCMIAFAMLTVVCARADSCLIVADINENMRPIVDRQNSIRVCLPDDVQRNAEIRFRHGKNAFLLIRDINSNEQMGHESENGYWLRSDRSINGTVICDERKQQIGTITKIVAIRPEIRTVAAAASRTRVVAVPVAIAPSAPSPVRDDHESPRFVPMPDYDDDMPAARIPYTVAITDPRTGCTETQTIFASSIREIWGVLANLGCYSV